MAISQSELIKISQKTNGHCFYCNSNNANTIDHFMPKSILIKSGIADGMDGLENLFISCKRCNSGKGTKFPEDFIGNDYWCWNRYYRANKRIGLFKDWNLSMVKMFI